MPDPTADEVYERFKAGETLDAEDLLILKEAGKLAGAGPRRARNARDQDGCRRCGKGVAEAICDCGHEPL